MTGHYILELNHKCNMNCLFCGDTQEKRNLPDPDFNEILAGIKKNRKKFDSMIITGGEPTIHKRLFEIIGYAKKTCEYSRISIATNALLMSYENFVKKLINLGVDVFQVSYFAPDKKGYDAVSRRKGSFELVNKGIKNIIKHNKKVHINTVVHRLNYRALPAIVEHLVKTGVNYIQLAFMNPIGESVKDGRSTMAVSYTEVMPFIKKSFEKAKELDFQNLYIENFPLCIAKDFINWVSDLKQPEDNKDYYTQSKIKPGKCSGCEYNKMCDGVWRAYIEQFGDEEIFCFIKEDMKNG
ncbi:radical SAM protein [Candidatus Woesearchaeota archaeon]|nr:radical SAM protein [Candidatus Woesearchaeota archaeon]